jgi:hypothetical protein
MSDRIIVPHFENESDEADWWFANRHEHDEIMLKAIAEGRTLTLKAVLAMYGLELPLPRREDESKA